MLRVVGRITPFAVAASTLAVACGDGTASDQPGGGGSQAAGVAGTSGAAGLAGSVAGNPSAGGASAGTGGHSTENDAGRASSGAGRSNAGGGGAGRSNAGGGGALGDAGGGGGGSPEGGEPSTPQGGQGGSSELGPFGIKQLYPSASTAARWTSEHWAQGEPYALTGRTDPNDPLRLSGMRGTGTLEVTGTGELVMRGSQPRIYVYPGKDGPWRDVEVTVYYQRVEDAGTAYAGLVVGVRSGDGHNEDTACDAHTYYARLRNDGAIDFEKELKHPASSTQSRVAPETVWPPDGRVPLNTWIGWKFVIYNQSATSVKLEAYRDLTGGKDGGDWKLMNETVDEGGWSVEDDCPAHSPSDGQSDMVVTEGGTTFIRNTEVTEARYRWFTIREIAPQ